MTNNDDDLADHVRSFLQVEPHIVCMAQPLQMGQLFVVMNNQIIVKVQNSISAIDIFFKSFKVFGLTIPSELAMMIDFLECALYHTVGHSSRKSVNLMAIAFKEVAHAEDAVFNE